MVISKDLFSEVNGCVFLIPFNEEQFVLAQVGFGGDLGVFDGLYDMNTKVDTLNPPLIFRVHYGRVSPGKFSWLRRGMLPYKDALSRAKPYLHQPVGSDECTLVQFGASDRLIECTDAPQYEPLATWSHEHILQRFKAESSDWGHSDSAHIPKLP